VRTRIIIKPIAAVLATVTKLIREGVNWRKRIDRTTIGGNKFKKSTSTNVVARKNSKERTTRNFLNVGKNIRSDFYPVDR
jgi:hypothetical protein